MADPFDPIYDPRTTPREPDWRTPEPGEEHDYYVACDEYDKAPPACPTPAPECPACIRDYPIHQSGCYIAGDFTSASHYNPADFHHYDKDF